MRKLFISVKDGLYQRFRRQTSSTAFIPEIDGLRFLAIILVVISHVQALYLLRSGLAVSFSKEQTLLQPLLENGESGVFLFFAISGFVLMLPFARHYFCSGGRVPLKKYYLRRLTRLEPPYFLAMVFLFVMKILVQHQDFAQLLPHLGATLLYLHTAIYHEMSKITPITWSLEIEIQFYLLAPLLAAVYGLPKVYRRALLCLLILLLISAVYYLLIEKPCMDPGWPQKMIRFLRSRRKIFGLFRVFKYNTSSME